MSKPKHILVMRLSAMGDVAMTVPVLKAFSLQYPEVKITVASRPFFKPFFRDIQNLDFFPVDVNGRHKGLKGLYQLFLDTKALGITEVADLHNVLRAQVVRSFYKLFGYKVAATDKGRADKKELTKLAPKNIEPVKSMFQRHAETFAQLGYPLDLTHPVFATKAVLTDKALAIAGNKTQRWIGIAPFAQYQTKVYPQYLMQQVIDALAKAENKVFLFGGGAKEIAVLNDLKKDYENVVVLAGKLTLDEEMDVISNLDVMLSMDSGNAHIAALLGVRVVTLWGATHPFAGFLPFNQKLSDALVPDLKQYPLLPTSVYGNKIVPGYEKVMETILVADVVNKLME
ncbi:glycosyltransferase family 9 protein [Flavobacterium agricola]|uniref:Glycosyltransferase family 9 protein n=1 Tax=Flavobacterium agricola TaxID=2870839 RepID=A0ABY6LX29_9FLAO|nr:glycosyltransferase family 9 protein [Flavobacterium agricola]UYW00903.1 glycosyltransferase family 9 protein [Flavobacterium agricola]